MKTHGAALLLTAIIAVFSAADAMGQTSATAHGKGVAPIPLNQITTTSKGIIYTPPGGSSITLQDANGRRPGALELSPEEDVTMTPEMKAARLQRVQEHQERIRQILEKRNAERRAGKTPAGVISSHTTGSASTQPPAVPRPQ